MQMANSNVYFALVTEITYALPRPFYLSDDDPFFAGFNFALPPLCLLPHASVSFKHVQMQLMERLTFLDIQVVLFSSLLLRLMQCFSPSLNCLAFPMI